ncbi:MAG: ABC transporter ATP-binding protein [Nocardioides sp.]|uniref:ABC transporter ATP-binding protein n=1 Tax=Nocardioides sp. TaxID=35761 RepID=UPI0039E66C38
MALGPPTGTNVRVAGRPRRVIDAATAVDPVHPWRSIAHLAAPHRRRVVAGTVAFFIKDAPFWVMPIVTANIVDAVVAGTSLAPVLINGAIGAATIVLNLPANAVFVRNLSATVRDIGAWLRNALTHRLQELSIGFHARLGASVTQSKVVRDVENVELMLQQVFAPVMSAVGVIVGAGIVVLIRVPEFAVLFVLMVPVAVALMHWLRVRSHERNETFRREVERLSRQVGEMTSLAALTRAHGLEQVATERVLDTAAGVRNAGVRLDRLNGRFGALSWVSYQTLGVICLISAATASVTGWLSITPGEVVLLSTYFTIVTNATTNAFALAPIVARGRESLRSVAEVLQEEDIEENRGKPTLGRVTGRLVFDDVGFAFPDSPESVLSRVSLRIEPGETIAFVGPSGAGKSTLINLALGFIRPTEGTIQLDGVDMAGIDLRSARRFFSVVPQEPVLFEGSIRENISYGLESASDARVQQALQDANAWTFVQSLDDGWDTPVGGLGSRLSGGQRQRLAIARALIRDPRVLILDEATSALDIHAESAVRDALERLRRDRTTLVVAHRLSTVRTADRIVVLDRGRIVESGSHEELAEAGGRYAHLLQSQAG